jgi:murein DD-endopeptidase MepM/ murein hydrolase activator NlpD
LTLAVAIALPATATAASGGSLVMIVPKIKQVVCARSCGKKHAIRAGSVIRLSGEDLEAVKKVIFLGSRGKTDDVVAPVINAKTKVATVRVPADTASGSLVAVTSTGARSRQSAPIPVLPQPPVIGTPDLQPADSLVPGVTLETGTSTPRVVFLGAKDLVRFSLRVAGAENASAAVTLVRQSTGAAVASWSVPAPPGQIVSVDWDGKVNGKAAPAGRYAFSAAVSVGAGPVASSAVAKAGSTASRDAFDLYGFVFPVRGKHNFGQGGARFGARRAGHTHQGQDVMAACGTKLVAARGGTVMFSRFQSAAGNFIVIRPDAVGDAPIGDQAYMHLITKSPFNIGDHVYSGQPIGNVGRTGDATACHLHFEEWTGAIWQSKFFDPLPDLLAWDQVS